MPPKSFFLFVHVQVDNDAVVALINRTGWVLPYAVRTNAISVLFIYSIRESGEF